MDRELHPELVDRHGLEEGRGGGCRNPLAGQQRRPTPTTLCGLGSDTAIKKEVRRLLDRRDGAKADDDFSQRVEQLYFEYTAWMTEERKSKLNPPGTYHKNEPGLHGFITLCQSASFLARGKD